MEAVVDGHLADRCPRCLRWIPNDEEPGAYPGAASRHAEGVYVCSGCGEDEAMRDAFGLPPVMPVDWPLREVTHGWYAVQYLAPWVGSNRRVVPS